jgi:nitroimidazol reductase NimA-like FMN-containing flavoprotein (pyridoxamine 5'-phosphate oxidase superfamily)
MHQPTTDVSRLSERQDRRRESLDAVLDSTPLATIAFVRDGHPVALPIGFARVKDELVIHGSTGSPWLREIADGAPVSVCVTTLDGILVARSGFESSFHYRSAVLFGRFTAVVGVEKNDYLLALTDTFIPGRVAELRASTAKELAATLVLRMPIEADNWSLKVADGWPEDDDSDVEAGGWAGVVPIVTSYGSPLRAPDCDPAVPLPESVRSMTVRP